MAKNSHVRFSKVALSEVPDESSGAKTSSSLVVSQNMLLKRCTEYNYVIQIAHANLPLQTFKYGTNKPLKRGWSVTNPERHDLKFIQSVGRDRCRLLTVTQRKQVPASTRNECLSMKNTSPRTSNLEHRRYGEVGTHLFL